MKELDLTIKALEVLVHNQRSYTCYELAIEIGVSDSEMRPVFLYIWELRKSRDDCIVDPTESRLSQDEPKVMGLVGLANYLELLKG